MNKSELVKILASKAKISPKKAEKMVSSFGDAITDTLAKGEKVVYSNFGTFYTVHYPSKVIFHPVLGAKKKMVMLPTNAVKWMPSGNIKEMVSKGESIDNAIAYGASKKLKNLQSAPKISTTPNPTSFEEESLTAGDKAPTNSIEESEVEVVIPIRTIKKTEIKEDKTNFWDNLLNKTAKESNQSKVSEAGAKEKTQPNAKDDKGPLVGTGLFGGSAETKKSIPVENTPKPSALAKKETEEELTPFIGRKTSISYIDLSKNTIPKEILQKIPEKVAREYKVVPVEDTAQELIVGMVDPEDIETIEIIKKLVGKKVSPRLTTESDISHVLDQYQGFESEVKEAIDDVTEDPKKNEPEDHEKMIASSAPASRIVSSLLKRAIRDKASDIHIEPFESEVVVRFRIDGVLHKKVALPKSIQQAVISRIKILSELKIDEQRLPQDGRFSIMTDSRKVDFRVSTMPIANGEKIVMRILDKLSGIISIDDLGFRERDLSLVNSACKKSHGMILVTGPTGSGKTTTLYALIDKIYSEGINIITLEDPIEYQIPGINQSQVNPEIDYTFASGLRSILRQDPDVVMIGEIRDRETSEMAVHAALTGHVVLSTLHTNDSAGAIPRLIDMKIEPFLLNSSLNLIVGQRLARKICDSCREEISLTTDQIQAMKSDIDSLPKTEKSKVGGKLKFYKGKGCKDCSDTGYKGRIGLYEVLEVSSKVKDLIAKEASSNEIKDNAVQEGMTTMIQDGILKAAQGLTTLEEVWRVTKE